METRPLGRSIHVALAAPTAACVVPALLVDSLGGMLRDAIFVAMTAVGALVALTWVLVLVIRWCLRGRPFHGPAVAGSRFESVLATLTGISLGAYAGVMQDVELGPMHFSAGVSYFGLLPLALLVCCPRRPAWRPFLDATLLMAGMEIAAQAALMITKYKRFHWWDDITGIDLGFWAGAMVASAFWQVAQRKGLTFQELVRIRLAVQDGEPLPPRKRND